MSTIIVLGFESREIIQVKTTWNPNLSGAESVHLIVIFLASDFFETFLNDPLSALHHCPREAFSPRCKNIAMTILGFERHEIIEALVKSRPYQRPLETRIVQVLKLSIW
jgi:hypothetical protein